MECWASALGNCSGSASREHYISDGIFDGESVSAQGLHWCKTAPVEIGLSSAVAKILCKRHNEALSPFDGEASRLSKYLLGSVLDKPLERSELRVDGRLLEKWALKTYANLGYIGALDPVHHTRVTPPPFLVTHIFEDTPLPQGIGLYFVSGKVSNADFRAGVSWTSIRNVAAGGEIVGMTFMLNSVRFVVSAQPGDAAPRLRRVGTVNDFNYAEANITYRPADITFTSPTAGQKQVLLNW